MKRIKRSSASFTSDNLKNGDVVSIQAVKMKNKVLAGNLLVKVIKKRDGLYFKPFLLKKINAIPLSAIDYFDPTWVSDGKKEDAIRIKQHIEDQGLLLYEVLWTVVSNVWEGTRFPAINKGVK